MSAGGSETAQGLTVAPGKGRPGEGHPRPGPAGLTGRAGWWLWAAGLAAAGVLLFTVYLRLTNTYPEDSDQANLGLQAWDMLRVIQGLFGVDGPRGPRGAFRERVRHAAPRSRRPAGSVTPSTRLGRPCPRRSSCTSATQMWWPARDLLLREPT